MTSLTAALTDINYTAGRLLDRGLIDALGTCAYIRERHNVIIMGATGSGKTYIGCALGMEACKQGFTVRYVRLPELLEELAIARGQGSFKKVLGPSGRKQICSFWTSGAHLPDRNGGQRSVGDYPRAT